MRRSDLKLKLDELVRKLQAEQWPLERLQALPAHIELVDGGRTLQAEVNLLECEENYVHIGVSLDDGRLFNTIFPVSSSFMVPGQP